METKTCKCCLIDKELNTDNFHHHYGYKDGWSRICRGCYNAKQSKLAKKRYHDRKKKMMEKEK